MADQQSEYDYDEIEAGYYDRVYHRGKGIQSKWHHLKFNHVATRLPTDFKRHLDIACGPGTFIGTLPDDRESIGADIAESQIGFAQAHYGTDHHRFEKIEPGALPYNDDSFDAVTLIELIEHLDIEVIRQLLTEVQRVLKPSGKVVLTTPNYQSLWPVLEKIVNRVSELSYEDQHITFFHRKRLKNLLKEVGFSRSSATTFHGLAPFAAALSWPLGDMVQRLENPLLKPGLGFLLLGEGYK